MIIILTVSSDVFSLNGVEYAKIYQPLTKGASAIGIFNIYNTKQFLINTALFGEYSIDGTIYASQALTIEALIPVIYKPGSSTGGDTGVYNETPAGLVNGTNKIFTVAGAPVAGSIRVTLQGVRQALTTQYTVAGSVITFVTAPFVDDSVKTDYDV